MTRTETNGFLLGLFGVLCWSPVFYVSAYTIGDKTALPVFYFYVLLWAAIASGLMLAFTGRVNELKIFKKRETQILLLTVTGGYGLWLLKGMAIQQAESELVQTHILFYLAPLLLGIITLPTRRGATWKEIGALLLGFVGCVLILAGPQGADQVRLPAINRTTVLALGAALCWVFFVILAHSLLKNENTLPVSTLIWGLGGLCLLATCVSTGNNILDITRRGIWISMAVGVGSVAIGMGLWLKCLSLVTPAFAAPIWYVSLIFGIAWSNWILGTRPGWLSIAGVVLILFVCRSGRSRDHKSKVTMSDIIRG